MTWDADARFCTLMETCRLAPALPTAIVKTSPITKVRIRGLDRPFIACSLHASCGNRTRVGRRIFRRTPRQVAAAARVNLRDSGRYSARRAVGGRSSSGSYDSRGGRPLQRRECALWATGGKKRIPSRSSEVEDAMAAPDAERELLLIRLVERRA